MSIQKMKKSLKKGRKSSTKLDEPEDKSGIGTTQATNRNVDAVLREAETEFKRRGKFNLIFPNSGNTLKNLFEDDQNIN